MGYNNNSSYNAKDIYHKKQKVCRKSHSTRKLRMHVLAIKTSVIYDIEMWQINSYGN